MPTETLNYLLALGTLAMQIVAAAFLVLYFLQRRVTDLQDIGEFLHRRGLWIGFFLSLGASALTLYYSEVLGFEACFWCWMQRAFLYPQIILFGLAIWKRDVRTRGDERGDRTIAEYSIALSIAGAFSALYHHMLQIMPAGTLPCPATGPSCAQMTLFEFGYITYPLMAFSLFAFLIVVMLFVRKR